MTNTNPISTTMRNTDILIVPPTPPNKDEITDALLAGPTVTDATRRAVCRALDIARERGRTFPIVGDCRAAATVECTRIDPVCGSWGYCRNEDDPSRWLNVRQRVLDDDRRGTFRDAESFVAFIAFCTFTETEIPFQYGYRTRPSPRPSQSTVRRPRATAGKSPGRRPPR